MLVQNDPHDLPARPSTAVITNIVHCGPIFLVYLQYWISQIERLIGNCRGLYVIFPWALSPLQSEVMPYLLAAPSAFACLALGDLVGLQIPWS